MLYLKRNKIPFGEILTTTHDGERSNVRIEMTFKSDWQLACFQRAGNKVFSHFEFL